MAQAKMLEGKVVIVTGAGGGIGSATTRALVQRGAHVTLVDLSQASVDAVANTNPAERVLALVERWLAEGWDLARPWNLLGQQTLMAQPFDAKSGKLSGERFDRDDEALLTVEQEIVAFVFRRRRGAEKI